MRCVNMKWILSAIDGVCEGVSRMILKLILYEEKNDPPCWRDLVMMKYDFYL